MHEEGRRTDAVHRVDVVEGRGALEDEPGGFDVVSKGDAAREDGPVAPEIELQVAGRSHHLGADDVQEVIDGIPEILVGPHLIEVRVGLEEVQVGIHRLVGVDVMGAEGHVLQRGEFPCQRFDVSPVLLVLEAGFYDPEEVDGILEDFVVLGGLVQFAQAVDSEGLRVELFLGVQALAGGIDTPVYAAVAVVAEMLQEVVPGMDRSHEVFGLLEGPVGRREGPHDAGVQNGAARSGILDFRRAVRFAVEAAVGILQGLPVIEDIGFEDVTDLLAKSVSSVHITQVLVYANLRKKPEPDKTFYSPRVATITALIVCIRFSASSKTMLFTDSKTSSVTSMPSRPNCRYTSRPACVSRLW